MRRQRTPPVVRNFLMAHAPQQTPQEPSAAKRHQGPWGGCLVARGVCIAHAHRGWGCFRITEFEVLPPHGDSNKPIYQRKWLLGGVLDRLIAQGT